jgi:hypothetical protein
VGVVTWDDRESSDPVADVRAWAEDYAERLERLFTRPGHYQPGMWGDPVWVEDESA